jgi:hypothetical protein
MSEAHTQRMPPYIKYTVTSCQKTAIGPDFVLRHHAAIAHLDCGQIPQSTRFLSLGLEGTANHSAFSFGRNAFKRHLKLRFLN